MSVSVTQQKQFIGGEFVDSISGETMEVLNPATGEVIAEVPRGHGGGRRPRGRRRREGVGRLAARRRRRTAWSSCSKLADVIDENAEELARLESLNVGKPWWVAVDEPGVMSDNLRFFAGAARNLEGKAATEYVEGYTSMIRREPLGIVAGICPVELPALHGDVEDRAGARGRQRPDHQAGRADAAHDAPLRRARAGGHPAGRAAGRDRRRDPGRRRARAPPVRSASSRSPATRRPGRSSRRTPRTRSSGCTSSSAGRRRWSCSTTPTRPTVAEAIKIGGYFNSGQDCTASSRILVSEKIYDDVLSATVEAVESMTRRRPGDGRRDRHGPGHLRRAAGARPRLPRARDRREGDDRHRRRVRRRPRVLRHADDRHRRRPERRDRPERGLRAGRDDAAVRLGRRGDRDGERRALRARRVGLLRERRPGDEGRGRSSTSARSGSTSTSSRSPPRCRTAASRSRATGRTCPSTRWRSTRGSSTSA